MHIDLSDEKKTKGIKTHKIKNDNINIKRFYLQLFFYIIFITTLYGFEKLLHILIKKQLKNN